MDIDSGYKLISDLLLPSKPVVRRELLRGRDDELGETLRCLRTQSGTPMIFGERGVGKTSLAKTAAQDYCGADRNPVYVAVGPDGSFLAILRDVCMRLSEMAIETGCIPSKKLKTEVVVGLSPAVKFTKETVHVHAPEFRDIAEAVRVLKDFDTLIQAAEKSVIILDELENLSGRGQEHLAYFVKQLGDQEFSLRFLAVGIAENISQLTGHHGSVPRYLRNIELSPLSPQALIDIVQNAADALGITIPKNMLMRIAIIGNGYAHFAHLMGLSILSVAVERGATEVSKELYASGVKSAVHSGIEELRACYEEATQRGTDDCKHVVWTVADMDTVDTRTEDVASRYAALTRRHYIWQSDLDVTEVLGRLRQPGYGEILIHTPKTYGGAVGQRRYRHQRFKYSLMRGYVRLRAEAEGVAIGTSL